MLEHIDTELIELRRFSAGLGRNPLLVQANTGNTSIKTNGTLWIKASGTWLQDAEDEDMFVAVPLSEVAGIAEASGEPRLYPTPSGRVLRASVETAMHGVLPYRVVVHVHSVNAIAWAVREDAPRELSERLTGIKCEWIDYVPSGWRLAQAIENALIRSPRARVFVLGNHGLVICGESCADVQGLLDEVEERLTIAPRSNPEPDWGVLQERASDSGWQVPQFGTVHALGVDPWARQISRQGVLHPCQALFFGDMLSAFSPAASVPGASVSCGHSAEQHFVILDGAGVLFSERITKTESAILIGFTEVLQRIDEAAPLRYLTDTEWKRVLDGDVHHYRQFASPLRSPCTPI